MKEKVFLVLLILLLFLPAVLGSTNQNGADSQTLDTKLLQCEQNLSLLYQQLQELNQTLKNVTQEKEYYKTLYQNMTTNVTNLELIQIKQNISVLNQQIQQLNVTISNVERNMEILIGKSQKIEIVFGSLVTITLIGTFANFVIHLKTRKNKNEK